MPADLLTPSQAAEILHVGPKALARYVAAGLLDAVWTPGGQRRYIRADVEALHAASQR